ncbi:MAG TPA: hypothetical protein VM165_18980 [Planctomycetaceae bacterium]|nr:hypothetical protein [Planctomycetaceae bacterium]
MDAMQWGIAGVATFGVGAWLLARWVAGRKSSSPRHGSHQSPRRDRTPISLTLPRAIVPLTDAVETIEDRIEQRLSELDRLIDEADEEIARLEATLAASRKGDAPDRALTPSEQQRCFAMWEAGFTVEEIAECLATAPQFVQAALDEWRLPNRRAA